jgi:hypothetical protein
MERPPAPEQPPLILRRVGSALITAVACAYTAYYADVSDPASLGAIVGSVGAALASATYGIPPILRNPSREDLLPFGVSVLTGLACQSTFRQLNIPSAAEDAIVAAMVVAGANELITGSGVAASFRALLYTAIVSVLGAGLAAGIGLDRESIVLVGGAVGLATAVIGASPMAALVGVTVGQLLFLTFVWATHIPVH